MIFLEESRAAYSAKAPIAVLDANVLFPNYVRDTLLSIAQTKLYFPKWSPRIEQEWTENLLSKYPTLKKEQITRTVQKMNRAFSDAQVEGGGHLPEGFFLPDENDHHVVATAIAARARYIITFNLKDFPRSAMEKTSISAIHPDKFLVQLYNKSPDTVAAGLRAMIRRYQNPPLDFQGLSQVLRVSNLKEFAHCVSKL